MKKILLPCLLFSMLFAGNLFAQQSGEQKGWPSAERYAFISECINAALPNLSEDSARFYCWCMQEKMEKKYPTIAEAGKITEDDMNSPAWQQDIKSCLGGTWGTNDRAAFLSICIESAKTGSTEEKAKTYCECMLFKMEIRYPNPADAANITEKDLATPEWTKIAKSCLDF